MSEVRYQELLPLLSRLNELEAEQKDTENFFDKKNTKKSVGGESQSGKGSSGSSKRGNNSQKSKR
jgi:hypothetical protein